MSSTVLMRDRLLYAILTLLAAFSLDLLFDLEGAAGAGYVLAVLVGLFSSRAWHSMLAAALGIALSFTAALAQHRAASIAALIHPLATSLIIVAATGIGLLRRRRAIAARSASGNLAAAAAAKHRIALDHLRMVTQFANISIWEWDLKTDELRSAEGSDALLGWGAQPLTAAEHLARFVHPDDWALTKESFEKAMTDVNGTGQFAFRYRSPLPDGGVRHIQLNGRVQRDEAGNPVSCVGINWDVTREVEAKLELQRQADRLRDTERRLERASLSSSEGHWELDPVKRERWYSSNIVTLLGYPEEELQAFGRRPFVALAHPGDQAELQRTFQHHSRAGGAFTVVTRLRTADGSYRWFRVRGAAELDPDGGLLRMAGSLQDIHDQKLAEDALQDVKARFERAIHGTQDGLWEADLTGDRTWFSPRVYELLGYEEGDLPNGSHVLRDLVHPEDVLLSDAAVYRDFSDRTPVDVEVRLRTKNQGYRWYRIRGRTVLWDGDRPLRVAGSIQDITEARIAREKLLRATEAAEMASSAKTAFLATMSHEIRTPMNGIIGMTGLLLDTRLDRVQREYAETIHASANSLLAIINDILDFSKIEAGKLDLEQIEMDLRNHVEDVGAMMALQAAAKSLELVVDVGPDVPSQVLGDPQRIRQCLINLVGNAIKFTAGGEVVIEVRPLGERDDGRTLTRFSVRDTGIGIAPEACASLFQPFTQVDSSTTRRFGGTGLGLSIVKRLVELMGGEVGVESAVGEGSTFWFTVPFRRAASASPPVRASSAPRGTPVLVVDDNETNRRVLAGQLRDGGYEVDLADSGARALEQVRQALGRNRPYGVILIDYQMPGMDGAELGEKLNADPQLSRSRLVLLTSLDRKGDHGRFAAMGFAAYLTKPVRARELGECLDRVLAHDAHEWHARTHPIITEGALANARAQQRYTNRVLLVEDNVVNQKVAQKFLERLGCSVRVANNGLEGVAAWEQEPFDVILMDMQMPVMDGLAAAREIRSRETKAMRRTPIVALTANVLASHTQSCLDAGMDDFLTKPLEVAKLQEVLERFRRDGSAAAAH